MFRERLNEYLDMLHCSGREFAEQCEISESTVSRYKSGARVPKENSEDMKKLCRGICRLAEQRGIDMSYKSVLSEFNRLAEDEMFDYGSLQTKFNMLCSVLSVNLADMSKKLKYDSSYISRIKNGRRKPANPQKFALILAVAHSRNRVGRLTHVRKIFLIPHVFHIYSKVLFQNQLMQNRNGKPPERR